MTTLQEALPCPFCGKQHTLQVISGQELMGEDQEFWQHSESFGVVCDASTPDGKGGCGATGGFKPTEDEAIEAWNTRSALAQQGEQQPVAWYEYNQDFDAWFLAYGHNPKAKTRPLVFGDTAAPAQKPVAYITQTEQGPMVWTPEMYDEACTYCDDGEFPVPLYTVTHRPTSGDYALGYAEGFNDACKPAPQAQPATSDEWLANCPQEVRDFANKLKAAPQPAQDVPEVGFGNIPTKFLANGTRFKLSFDTRGKVSSLWNFMDELDGRWVALVAAEDDCHLQSAQPVAQQAWQTATQVLEARAEAEKRLNAQLRKAMDAMPIAQPVEQPLNPERIEAIFYPMGTASEAQLQIARAITRAIEAAHGIVGRTG